MPYIIKFGPLYSTEPSVLHSEGIDPSTGAKIVADLTINPGTTSNIKDARLGLQYFPGTNSNSPQQLHLIVRAGIANDGDYLNINCWNHQATYNEKRDDPADPPATIVWDDNDVPVPTPPTLSFEDYIVITVKKSDNSDDDFVYIEIEGDIIP